MVDVTSKIEPRSWGRANQNDLEQLKKILEAGSLAS